MSVPKDSVKTSSGAVFHSKDGEPPILKEVLMTLYTQRKSAKKKYFECEKEIEEIKKAIKDKKQKL